MSSLAEVSIHPFQRTTSVELLCTSASRRFTRLTRKWTPVGFPILSSDLGTGQPPARPTRKRTLVETAHAPFYQPTSSHTSGTKTKKWCRYPSVPQSLARRTLPESLPLVRVSQANHTCWQPRGTAKGHPTAAWSCCQGQPSISTLLGM